mmetsp:Transcript_30310/g.54888  ORF Transcript_30310/g.54888 Transcript_30310/m.54888 type:complete len:332 (+) Transcript_30310:118-1113(+)
MLPSTFSRWASSNAPKAKALLQLSRRQISSTPAVFSNFDKLGIIGLGLMGHGIAQTAAASQIHSSIIAYETDSSFLDRGRDRIQKSVEKLVSKERLSSEDADALMGKITFTTDRDALNDTDLIVEAIIENLDLKKQLYSDLGQQCKPETIFASNTSSLSITKMALASGRPDKFVGVHFFNPVQLMKLVEIIRTDYTDQAVLDKTVEWVEQIGKAGVGCSDTPGFIVNRLLVPSLVQAILLVERGDASTKDVDLSMQLGAGHPMGPLHLADYVGLDTCLSIMEGWVKDFPEERAFVVPDILREKVERNELGRKTGKGFYQWDGDKRGDPLDL